MSTISSMLITLLPEEATALLLALGGAVNARVHLVIGDLGVEEALAFASWLDHCGQDEAAAEIVFEVLRAALG